RPLIVLRRGEKFNVLVGICLQAGHPVPPPIAEPLLVRCETVKHGSAHLDFGCPESLAAHVVLDLAGDAFLPFTGKLVLSLQRNFFLTPTHKRISRCAAETFAVVKVPLQVDDLRSCVQNHCLAYVKRVGERSDTLKAYLDSRC